jgi:hypothetical protein
MRSALRVSDLKNMERGGSRLMTVNIPAYVSDAIQKVASDLGASKAEVVIALLNEGLDVASSTLKNMPPTKSANSAPKRLCGVDGCNRPHAARGFCLNHYQAARRGKIAAAAR